MCVGGDFSASVKSDCTCFRLQHPCGVSSPKLISHFASSQPDSFSILRHSPAHFSTVPRSCNLCVHRLKGQAAAGREGKRDRKGWEKQHHRGSKPGYRKTHFNLPGSGQEPAGFPSFHLSRTHLQLGPPALSEPPAKPHLKLPTLSSPQQPEPCSSPGGG